MNLAKQVATVIQSDKRRVIVGAGVTGLSCARYFADRGQQFALIDTRELVDGVQELQNTYPEATFVIGDWGEELLMLADELYVSPGVSLSEPPIDRALSNGAVLCSDIDIFAREAKAPVIAITGSNAKSTVTTMVGQILSDAGFNVGVGGNLGPPALNLLNDERDFYVLELSSFQLERCKAINAKVACLLNVTEDHLDRHGSMVEYHRLKQRIFQGASVKIYHRNDPLTAPLESLDSKTLDFGVDSPDLCSFGVIETADGNFLAKGREHIMPVSELPLVGKHNALNALAAIAIVDALGVELTVAAQSLRQFKPLRHRCEQVARAFDVTYVNDSKATNVGATVAALKGLGEQGKRNIVLIVGGDGKGADFSPLAEITHGYCRLVICIGRDALNIKSSIGKRCDVLLGENMHEAVSKAVDAAQAGDVVLLSPACASMDMFDSYEHRGQVFTETVRAFLESREW